MKKIVSQGDFVKVIDDENKSHWRGKVMLKDTMNDLCLMDWAYCGGEDCDEYTWIETASLETIQIPRFRQPEVILDRAGFSILETVMAMALVSMTSLAFASVSGIMNLTQNMNDARLSTNSLAASLLGSFNNSTSCTNGLLNVAFDATQSVIPVAFSLPTRVISAGASLIDYKLNVSSLAFTNYKQVQTTDGSVVYFGDIVLTTTSQRKVMGSNNYKALVDSVYLTVNSGLISGCSVGSTLTNLVSNVPQVVATAIPTIAVVANAAGAALTSAVSTVAHTASVAVAATAPVVAAVANTVTDVKSDPCDTVKNVVTQVVDSDPCDHNSGWGN